MHFATPLEIYGSMGALFREVKKEKSLDSLVTVMLYAVCTRTGYSTSLFALLFSLLAVFVSHIQTKIIVRHSAGGGALCDAPRNQRD